MITVNRLPYHSERKERKKRKKDSEQLFRFFCFFFQNLSFPQRFKKKKLSIEKDSEHTYMWWLRLIGSMKFSDFLVPTPPKKLPSFRQRLKKNKTVN